MWQLLLFLFLTYVSNDSRFIYLLNNSEQLKKKQFKNMDTLRNTCWPLTYRWDGGKLGNAGNSVYLCMRNDKSLCKKNDSEQNSVKKR